VLNVKKLFVTLTTAFVLTFTGVSVAAVTANEHVRLQQQINQLKSELDELKKEQASTEELREDLKQVRKFRNITYLGGTPVTTSPYLGVRSSFEGGELIVNISSVNQDLRLLQQHQKLENQLAEEGESLPENPFLELSGAIEGQTNYIDPFRGHSTTDIDLSGAEIDIAAYINKWVTGFMTIVYDNSLIGPPRASNSRLFVDTAFLTIGNLNSSPVYFTLGQIVVPFGQHASFMLSTPPTASIAKTKARAALLGFQTPGNHGFYGAIYVFHGDSKRSDSDSRINQVGGNFAYNYVNDTVDVDVGVSFINNMADANGYQATGGSIFPGFGSTGNTLDHRVPAVATHLYVTMGPVTFLGEYAYAMRHFDGMDLSFNGNGAQPEALNAEVSYKFSMFDRPSRFSVGYAHTNEALALNLPKHRYIAAFSTNIWKKTIAAIEYRFDDNYNMGDSASGEGGVGEIASVGGTSHAVTAQFGMYF